MFHNPWEKMLFQKKGNTGEGFTLIEVLVALTVAGILSVAFIGLQRQAIDMALNANRDWDHMNMFQDFLVHRKEDEVTQAWIPWPESPDAEWRQSQELIRLEQIEEVRRRRGFGNIVVIQTTLQARMYGTQMTWDWYTADPRTLRN